MFVFSHRNVMLPSKDHSQVFPLQRGYAGNIPDWAAETEYFRRLVADGKISLPESRKDKDLQEAAEKPTKRRRKVEE